MGIPQLFLFLAMATSAAAASTADCSENPGCAGLEGQCCPTDSGVNLGCCSPAPAPPTVGGCVSSQFGCCPGSDQAASGPDAGGCPATPSTPVAAADEGGCAVDITTGIAAITSAAKFINYAVDDCPGVQHQRACADDITSAITDFAGASKAIASATSTCGGKNTECAKDITNTIASLSAASETLICAATDCEASNAGYDVFQCVVDIFDVVDTLTHFSKSTSDAVDHCGGPAETTQACDGQTSGQKQVVVDNCQGVGCNANGDDPNCAWCVTDLATCSVAFGEQACTKTQEARVAQGVDCTGMSILPAERRLRQNV